MAIMFATMLSCDAAKIQGTPDKAILAYAEAYAFAGSSNAASAGLTEIDISEAKNQIKIEFAKEFEEFCLSDESLDKLTDVYISKLQSSMELTTKLKKKSSKVPLVTVTGKILDKASFNQQGENDENIIGLAFAIAGLKDKGKTDEDLKVYAEYQEAAVTAITNFIDALQFTQIKSLDIICTPIQAVDGKTYWAPKDAEELMNFVQGK